MGLVGQYYSYAVPVWLTYGLINSTRCGEFPNPKERTTDSLDWNRHSKPHPDLSAASDDNQLLCHKVIDKGNIRL